ncbi:hypothetical protein [Amycolatopsis sp. NPDC051372]|uniref:hypothetical protein n=1 Tax=Amycolatopsis sp. NPDC051372 TaxID=3155669 RepID=UPI00344312CF
MCWRREHPAEPAAASTVAHPVDPNQIPLPLETPVDDVNSLINQRLGEFQKLADQTSEAIISGATEPPAAFAFMLRNFVEATYLAVLAQVKPDLAEATAAWLKDATEAADGTVLEVAYEWRQQIAAGDTLWLPHLILERL